jgi:hypothetical protein
MCLLRAANTMLKYEKPYIPCLWLLSHTVNITSSIRYIMDKCGEMWRDSLQLCGNTWFTVLLLRWILLSEVHLVHTFQKHDLFQSSGAGIRDERLVLSWTHRRSKSPPADVQWPRPTLANRPNWVRTSLLPPANRTVSNKENGVDFLFNFSLYV